MKIINFIFFILDIALFLPAYLIFVSAVFFIVVFGKIPGKPKPYKKNRKILRFCALDTETMRAFGIKILSNSNLDGFFSKSVIVFLPNTVYKKEYFEAEDMDIIQISQHPDTFLKRIGFRKMNSFISEVRVLTRLFSIIRKEGIDILVAQDPHLLGVNAFILSRLTGVPYAVHVITNYDIKDRLVRKLAFPPFMFKVVENAVERFIFKNASFVTASYENYRDYAILHGALAERTFALRTAVDDVHFKELHLRRDLKRDPGLSNKKILLYVGRLAAVKFPLDVIKCAAIVMKQRADIVLVMVGSGPLEEEAKDLARSLGIIDRILFFKSKTQDELADLYHSSDVIIFSHAGMTLVEAALSGKPIIAYDYEWHPEVIGKNEERGYLVPFRDYKMMAEKTAGVLNNYSEAIEKAKKARFFCLERFNRESIISLERAVFEKYFE